MRLTLVLQKVSYQHLRKQMWKKRSYVRATPLIRTPYLEGFNIVDPNIVPTKPEPVLPDSPQYQPNHLVHRNPNYHKDQFVYEYNIKTKLMENLTQASLLTKTQVRFGLPQAVDDCVGLLSIPQQDKLVQRYIMQANVWDPTKEKLPKRINKQLPGWKYKAETGIPPNKIQSILIQNLLRLCGMICGRYDDILTSRTLLQSPYLSVSYTLSDGSPLMIRGGQECMLTSERPLDNFADSSQVKQTSSYDLPDMQPILPTIDLIKQRLFREGENLTGYHEGFPFHHPHTLYMGAWHTLPVRELQTKMLMHSFGYCLANAKARYGPDVTSLPEPISMQCVLTDGTRFLFSCYQLNTVDFSSSDGIKNLIWFGDTARMYKKILPKRAMLRNTKYEDYDPSVFRKFLGLYVYGTELSLNDKRIVEDSS